MQCLQVEDVLLPGKVHVPATMGGSSSRLTMPPAESSADKPQDNGCPPLQWHLCASKATTDPPCPTSGSEEAFLKSGCAALTATTCAGMLLAAPTPSQESPLRLCTRCRGAVRPPPLPTFPIPKSIQSLISNSYFDRHI